MEIIQNSDKATKGEFKTGGSNCSQGRCLIRNQIVWCLSDVQVDESQGEVLLDSGSGIDITLNTGDTSEAEAGQAEKQWEGCTDQSGIIIEFYL